MSLYVRVWDCRPSVLATAFARLVAGPLPAGGWDDLDRENFLEKGLSQSSRGGLRNEYEEAYFADRAEAAESVAVFYLASGYDLLGFAPSPTAGRKGNREAFLRFARRRDDRVGERRTEIIPW